MKNTLLLLILMITFGLNPFIQAQDLTIQLDSTTLSVSTIAEELYVPWEICWGPDDKIWLTERNGVISRIDPDTGEKEVLLEIEEVEEIQESGLLGMAIHPDFDNSPYIYVVYNYFGTELYEKLVRYTYEEDALVDPVVLIDEIIAANIHNGSRIAFLPDNTILMSTGDARDQPASQDVTSLSGKFLRLTEDGEVPEDNPIVGSYVYSWGHRNPQGLIIGPNDIIYSSEHGPQNDDEINIIESGRNYGWPDVHGFCDSFEQSFCDENEVVEPLIAWTPTLAVAGIDYYDHPAIPEWNNSLILATLRGAEMQVLHLSEDGKSIINNEKYLDNEYRRFRDVCVAPDGRIFITTSNRDAYGVPTPGDDRLIEIKNADYVEEILMPKADFTIQDSCRFIQFINISENAVKYEWEFGDGGTSTLFEPLHVYSQGGGTYNVKLTASKSDLSDTKIVQLLVIDCNGVSVEEITAADISVYPNPLDRQSTVEYPAIFADGSLLLSDIHGKEIRKISLDHSLQVTLKKENLSSGIYFMNFVKGNINLVKRILVK